MNKWALTRGVFASVGGALGWLFGDMTFMLFALLALEIIDYVTGVMSAIAKKELSSRKSFLGILRKFAILLIVALGHLLDMLFHTGDAFRTAVCFFYIANEAMSIIENAAMIGLPVPQVIKNVLAQIKSKADKGEEVKVDVKVENKD